MAFSVKLVWRDTGQRFESSRSLDELLEWADGVQAEEGDTARVTIWDDAGEVVYDWIAEWWKSEDYRRTHSVPPQRS